MSIFLETGLRIYYYFNTEMFVFRCGKWHTVVLPSYIDPAWGFGDRQKVASIIVRERMKGLSEADAFLKAEAEIYRQLLDVTNP